MSDDIINILNLNPDLVQSCSSKMDKDHIFYFITLIRKDFFCPNCLAKLSFKDYRPIKIHHEIIRGTSTIIVFKRRRYYCNKCNSYHYESNPFSSVHSPKFSDLTSMLIMDALKETSATFSMVSRQFNTTPTKVISIFDTFGQMYKLPFPEVISIDEFYWNRCSSDKYACLLLDFSSGQIVDIFKGRTLKNWNSYLQLISEDDIKQVKYICIDMFYTYRQVQKLYFPSAILCVDSFHVIKNIHQLLKNERIRVMKKFDSGSVQYYLLKNFNWLLMTDSSKIQDNKAKYNKKLGRYINYPQLLELILNIDPLLKEAYVLKEDYLIFNQTSTIDNARQNLVEIITSYANSNVSSFNTFSSTLVDWYEEIINSFTLINHKRISNGRIESINARIKVILKNANGYRNFSRMRNRLIYSINKNALPSVHNKNQVIKQEGKKRGRYKKKQ